MPMGRFGLTKFMPRYFPDRMKVNQKKRRSTSTGMLCIKWMDKRALYLLFTLHKYEMVETERENRNGEKVVKPKANIDYNESKKRADVGDQLASSYPAVRSLKWYKKVFMYLFDMAMINSFLISKPVSGNIGQQLILRQEVVRGLFMNIYHKCLI